MEPHALNLAHQWCVGLNLWCLSLIILLHFSVMVMLLLFDVIDRAWGLVICDFDLCKCYFQIRLEIRLVIFFSMLLLLAPYVWVYWLLPSLRSISNLLHSATDKPVADTVWSKQLLPFSQWLPRMFWDMHPCLFQNLWPFPFQPLRRQWRVVGKKECVRSVSWKCCQLLYSCFPILSFYISFPNLLFKPFAHIEETFSTSVTFW